MVVDDYGLEKLTANAGSLRLLLGTHQSVLDIIQYAEEQDWQVAAGEKTDELVRLRWPGGWFCGGEGTDQTYNKILSMAQDAQKELYDQLTTEQQQELQREVFRNGASPRSQVIMTGRGLRRWPREKAQL